ncbi:kinase-like domain-containing protein [Pelagophyceae sp. CCMP2097]|nr:kinase-like domain-containing protein [Pelagophyceae sp. CCMP2097]
MDARARAAGLACFSGGGFRIEAAADVREALRFGEGRTNTNFVATDADAVDSGRRYFVRIGHDLPAFGVCRKREQAACRAAAAAGVGARVHFAELPDALVCDLIQGDALTDEALHEALARPEGGLLNAVTTTLRKLHAAPLPLELQKSTAARWAPPDLLRWVVYLRAAGFTRMGLLDAADAAVAAIEAFAGPPLKAAFCHFDLLPDNFVVARGPCVYLVDFEFAEAGQPLVDLAVLAMATNLDAAQEAALLKSYLGADAGDFESLRFNALRVLATLREALWGAVAECSATTALSPDAAKGYTDAYSKKFYAALKSFECARNAAAETRRCDEVAL